MKKIKLSAIIVCMLFLLGACSGKNDIPNSVTEENAANTSEEQRSDGEVSAETEGEISAETEEEISAAIGETEEDIVQAPSKEEVLSMREKVLAGMSDAEIKRLTTNIKDINNTWEGLYFYSDIFAKLEDSESLYWNYIDDSGDILVQIQTNADGTTSEITDFNRFRWESLIELIQDMQKSVQDEKLNKQLDFLVEEIRLAHETHDVQHAINMFHILHDMDYFLLRYGIEDVGKYLDDSSFVATYYGSLSMYEMPEDSEESEDMANCDYDTEFVSDEVYKGIAEQIGEINAAQIRVLAEHSDKWKLLDYAPVVGNYAVYDLDGDGRLELIANAVQGTGMYSDNYFHQVNTENTDVVELEQVSGDEWGIGFDLGIIGSGTKAYIDEKGICYYTASDYTKSGIWKSTCCEGCFYLVDGSIHQAMIRVKMNDLQEDEAGRFVGIR